MEESRRFKIPKDPLDAGFEICRKRTIEINSGFTVLVGCNGTGKTTVMNLIKDELKSKKIPLVSFDNLNEGGSNEMSHLAFSEDYETLSKMFISSEGERIGLNISLLASSLLPFVETGRYKKHGRTINLDFWLSEEDRAKKNAPSESNERWILMDAVDSGFSIDNVDDFKEFVHLVIEDGEKKGKKVFIVVTANSYELACGENCFDVRTGRYIPTFTNYDDYKKFILKSREYKDKRYENS